MAWLGLPWPIAALAGVTLALSSTAVAMQAMGERSLLRTTLGERSCSVLLFQDLAAIPLIAMILLLAGGDAGTAATAWDWRR